MRNECMVMLVLFPFVTQTFAMTADGESAFRNGALAKCVPAVSSAVGGKAEFDDDDKNINMNLNSAVG